MSALQSTDRDSFHDFLQIRANQNDKCGSLPVTVIFFIVYVIRMHVAMGVKQYCCYADMNICCVFVYFGAATLC